MIWLLEQVWHLIWVMQIFKLLKYLAIPTQMAIMFKNLSLMIQKSFLLQANAFQSGVLYVKLKIIKNSQKYTHNSLLTLCAWYKVWRTMNHSIDEIPT